MRFLVSLSLIFVLTILLFSGCGDGDNQPQLDVPTTYDFENSSYDGQLQRLRQMVEITAYNKTANTSGVTLDAGLLLARYANTDGAGWSGSYDNSKQLRSKTLSSVRADFDAYLIAIAQASTSDQSAAEGQAGVAVSIDGSKQYLLTANGVELTQIIEKGLMGACFYYQATAVYLGEERMNVDNETVTTGEGTEMEHHWDEAFGYFGVPRAFPIDTDGASFWGKYCNDRDAMIGSNDKLMGALLKGRAAVSANRLDLRDEAIAEVRTAWEKVAAATAIHYLNSALINFDDFALRAHDLSEAAAFTYALKFNPAKRMDNTEIDEQLILIGGAVDFLDMNFYQTTSQQLTDCRDNLARAFVFTTFATQL